MMFDHRWAKQGLILLTIFIFTSVLAIDAWARAGGGRSMGSRGSRTYSAPAPAPSSPYQGSRPSGAPAQPAPAPAPSGGGFFRGMAGGIAGGILGGMLGGRLFRGLGFAGNGGLGGGIGLMDIVLIGAILYGIFWFIKRRRTAESTANTPQTYYREAPATEPAYEPAAQGSAVETGLRHLRQMDPGFDEKRFTDGCLDLFFKVQGAWANRDMAVVRSLLTDEMFRTLNSEAEQLKAERRINRLENIAVRTVEIVEVWQEKGEDFLTVRLLANLLDYTVDERSGDVLSGSKTEPVKFCEYWTLTRPVGDHPWRLSAIQQGE